MSGFFDSLDTLISTAGNVVTSDNAAKVAAQTQNNATAANAVAVAQTAKANNQTWLYAGLGAVGLIIIAIILARK